MSAVIALLNRTQTPAEDIVRAQVRKRLTGRIVGTRLAQAEARAERHVWAGKQMQVAIDRACAWALCADPTDPQEAA